MPTQEEARNIEVVSKYFSEYWGKANADVVDELCAEDFVINYPMHGPRHGKAEAKRMLNEFKAVGTAELGLEIHANDFEGVSRHLVPRISASPHCKRAVRRWSLDWWRNSRRRCFRRSCRGRIDSEQHGQEDVLLGHHHLHVEGREDRGRDRRRRCAYGSAEFGIGCAAEPREGGAISARVLGAGNVDQWPHQLFMKLIIVCALNRR